MICRYGMLFQLYPLPNLNPHQPQFITKSYGTSCLYAQAHAMEAQLTLCKGITFSDYLLHAHTNYNFGRTHRHKGALAIRRIFSLVDMITKHKFSNCSNLFKIGLFR